MSAGYSPINTWDERQGTGSMLEDLWDVITNIDPTETQLSSGLSTIAVSSVHHEWPVDTLAAGATIFKNSEGFTPAYNDVTNVKRLDNYTQNISAEVKVTDTMRAVKTAGQYADDLARQKANALKVLKNRIEASLMAGTIATGSSTVARGMSGFKDTAHWDDNSSHSILTTSPSGVSLSETMLNDYLANMWNATKTRPNECYVGSTLKRRISGFTGGSTKQIDAEDKRLVNAVDVYESDFGLMKIFLHFYANQDATDNDMVIMDSSKAKIGFLVKPEYKEAAKTGSFTAGWYETEVTLQIDDPRAVSVIKRLK